MRARLGTAAVSTRPFNERLALFWANHFTVSLAKASARGIVGACEREAAPSPAGWPDRAEEWIGPDAVCKRVEWATRVALRAALDRNVLPGSPGLARLDLLKA